MSLGPLITDEGVRHSLLALASTYVLDYQKSQLMRARANHHYQRAVDLLGMKLAHADDADDAQRKAMIGSIILLNAHDVKESHTSLVN